MNSKAKLYQAFVSALNSFDRASAVKLVIDALENSEIDLVSLYEEVLAPSLNTIASNDIDQTVPIWQEHVNSGIVRTALEASFPFVSRERIAKFPSIPPSQRALVFCLEEEYHEIGARMTADYLTLLNYEVIYIGANTPKREVFQAIESLKPQLVCISVTNYFHLTRLHELMVQLNPLKQTFPFNIVAGGYAIHHTPHAKDHIHADFYANSFDDLVKIKEATYETGL